MFENFRLGNLRASLSKKELDELSDDTLRDSVKEFGRTVLPPYKVRITGLYVREVTRSVRVNECWKGVRVWEEGVRGRV